MKSLGIVQLAMFAMAVFGNLGTASTNTIYSFTNIDVPGAIYTIPSGIDNSGQIVGYSGANGGIAHGFLYKGSTFTTIDFPGASSTYASGINNSGQIVGTYYDITGAHGFLDTGGIFTTIDFPWASSTDVYGINNSGQIVGNYYAITWSHGFLARPTGVPEPSTLPLLAGCFIALAVALRRTSVPSGSWTKSFLGSKRRSHTFTRHQLMRSR